MNISPDAVAATQPSDDVFVCSASLPQQGLWFLDRLNPGSAAYNIVSTLSLEGNIDWPLLQRSIDAIVARHESLRTTFAVEDGELVQVIHPPAPLPIRMLSAAGPSAEADARRLAAVEAATPFNLSSGPLIRLTAIAIAPARHLLVLVVHHIVSDGWSQTIVLDELGTLYRAFLEDRDDPLPPVALQYADYCTWQDQRLQPSILGKQLDYWKGRLDGAPEALDLPTDFPRPASPSGRGDTVWSEVEGKIVTGLRQLARSEGATMFMVLMAALDVLLVRHSGQTDIVVGTPITGRSRPELEHVVGFFANTTVVRADLDGDPTFREVLRRVKASALGAYAHQDVPFHQIVDVVHRGRIGAHNPIFQVMCVVLRVPDSLLSLPGVRVEYVPVGTGTSKFDLLVDFSERADSLLIGFEYSTDLLTAPTAERWSARLRQVLKSIGEAPDQPISCLPMALDDEAALIAGWNATAHPLPEEATVVDLIERAAALAADAPAVVARDESLTYAELMRRVRRFRSYLRARGVVPGDLVGVCLDRSVDMVVAVLGIMDLGAAYLPLDPVFPAGRLAFMIEDAGVRTIVTATPHESLLPDRIDSILLDRDWPAIDASPDDERIRPVDGSGRAYVLYTSGSTGVPKGVQIPHRALVNFLVSMQREPGFGPTDRLLAVTTLSFDIAGLELYLPLISGGSVVIAEREQSADPLALASLLRAHDITVLQATPATWRLLVDSGWTGKSNLRILCGGEAMTRDLADRLVASGAEVWNLYGPTETTIWSTIERIDSDTARITIGRPIANTQLHIVDASLRPAPIGVAGELLIGGAGLALGYLNRDELTASRFIPDHVSQHPGARLYRTGDQARFLADGRVEWLGRGDHQVKVRGYRIELGEIEALLNDAPEIVQAVVVVHEAPGREAQLVAYVVPAPTTGNAEAEVLAHWQGIWDQTYAGGALPDDPTFDISGWHSSYTGESVPIDDMREWVDQTVARLMALQPTRVLEIGCGTGLLLHRIAPRVSSYAGVDLSSSSVTRLQEQVAARGLGHVAIHVAPADQAVEVVTDRVDLVILNSVVQYFPSADYLSSVIERLLDVVAPGGHIVLGDIRHLDLLTAFHTSVSLAQANADVSLEVVKAGAADRVAHESELLLSPAFFHVLQERHPRISAVTVTPKGGVASNEMTMFRYDVTLEIEGPGRRSSAGAVIDGGSLDLAGLERLLAAEAGPIRVNNLVDPRPRAALRAVDLMESDRQRSAGSVRDELAALTGGVEPSAVLSLGTGRRVRLELSADAGRYDATFTNDDSTIGMPGWADPERVRGGKPLANRPLHAQGALTAALRSRLTAQLPSYMVPSAFVVLDELPLTPNGKIDRGALPAPPALVARQPGDALIPPVTDNEHLVAGIWRDVLGLSEIGVRDNFFDIGGHSMAALRIFVRIEQETGVALPLSTLFQAPTIADLAATIDDFTRRTTAPQWPSIVTIKDGPGPTLVGVHSLSGDVLEYRLIAKHLPDDVGMIGLQASLGAATDIDAVFGSIEATAEHYVRELRRVQPNGPYYLCGWSSGGATALEMAQRLRREGADVALLAVIDSAPYNIDMPALPILSKYARLLANVPAWIRDDLLATPVKTMAERVLHRLRVARRQVTGAASTAPTVRDVIDFPARSARWERFAELHYRAFRAYTPAPYGGNVSLIVAPTGPLTWLNDAEAAWRVLAHDVDVYVASGTHFSIVREPHVQGVARALRDALADATAARLESHVSPTK